MEIYNNKSHGGESAVRAGSLVKQLLPKGGFARGVAVLASGTASGQAIVILASPILARLYTPGEFAVLALYASILAIMAICVGFRYELAIPLPEKEKDAVAVLCIALSFTTLITSLASVLIVFFGEKIAALLNIGQMQPYLWLLPFGIALTGVYQIFSSWAIREKAFGMMSKTKIQQGLGGVLTQVFSGLSHFGATGLIVGHIAGQVVGFASLARLFITSKTPGITYPRNEFLKNVRGRAMEYRNFPMYSMPTGLLNSFGMHAPILIMTMFFDPVVVGLYFLAHRTLMAPISVLTDSVSKVFTGQAAKAFRDGELGRLIKKIQSGLIHLSVGPFLMIIPVAPVLFKVIFGSQWVDAGHISQVLIAWLLWLILANPVGVVFGVVNKQSIAFKLEVMQFCLRVTSLIIGGILSSFYFGLVLFVVTSVLTISLKLYLIHSLSGASFRSWITTLLRELAISLPGVGLSFLAFNFLSELYGFMVWLMILMVYLYRSGKSYRSMRRA
jgi:O-antigen/teichoic acid export membrane protein